MTRVAVMALGVLALVVASATPGFAQDSRGDIAGGWQYLHAFDSEGDDLNMPKGFFVEGAGNLTPMFAVVGEYSANFKNETETVADSGVSIELSGDLIVQTFMGGVRVGGPAGRMVRPFADVLLGGVHQSLSVKGTATAGGVTISDSQSDSSTDFGFDLGGGVDVRPGGRVGVRAKASYLRVTGDNGGNAFRFQVGVVIPF